jgi:hypothetical protein
VIEGTPYARGATVEDVGVDHGRGDVSVAEELLDGANVVSGLQQVCGKGVTERVAGDALADAGAVSGLADPLLDDGFMEVMAAALFGRSMKVGARGRGRPTGRAKIGRLGVPSNCVRTRRASSLDRTTGSRFAGRARTRLSNQGRATPSICRGRGGPPEPDSASTRRLPAQSPGESGSWRRAPVPSAALRVD